MNSTTPTQTVTIVIKRKTGEVSEVTTTKYTSPDAALTAFKDVHKHSITTFGWKVTLKK